MKKLPFRVTKVPRIVDFSFRTLKELINFAKAFDTAKKERRIAGFEPATHKVIRNFRWTLSTKPRFPFLHLHI